MCGIGGVLNSNNLDIVEIMLPIKKRGESFNEFKIINNSIISCNRLKIIDRDYAKQPISNEDNTKYIIFNGEIYNYKKIKSNLIKKGHKFKTDSDTETILHGFEEYGVNILNKLDGQFAFLIVDAKKNNYFAARDHFGIKPLFFGIKNKSKERFIVSEAKQIINICDKIIEIKPGQYIDSGKIKYYYKLPKTNKNHNNLNVIKKNIKQYFNESVKKRVNTDLKIGVFLSGGIDSTLLLHTALKYHTNVTAIAVGKKDSSDMLVAEKYCTENNIKLIKYVIPEDYNLLEYIPNMVYSSESFEPNMINQFYFSHIMSKIAYKNGFKVVLCGEGADELFAGYPEFNICPLSKVKQISLAFFKNLYKTQLQRVDRASTSNTIEVRVPFFDRKLVEYVLNIDSKLKIKNKITKWILREAFRDELPSYIVDRPKVVMSEGAGFGGNSHDKGVFSKYINRNISDKDLNLFKNKYKKYDLNYKDEIYCFKYFLKYGFTKIKLTKRPLVNRNNSLK